MFENEMKYFVTESNRIEGIFREPTQDEITEAFRFMGLEIVTVGDLQNFVDVYQPGALLRERLGMNVRVGRHIPPSGGPEILEILEALLDVMPVISPWDTHIRYETLHPFMDGNGRSGRMLWLWQTKEAPLGFLQQFYYQTLDGVRS